MLAAFGPINECLSNPEDSGQPPKTCRDFLEKLLQWISVVNLRLQQTGQRTLLPFKLHQFISQTGSVYTTLDQDENRFATLEPGVYKQDEADKKPIFPNVFSRATGHAFICVSRIENRLEPREFRKSSEDDTAATDGYLIIGEDVWNPPEDYQLLPESWLRMTKNGPVPDTKKKAFFPTKLYFDEWGNCSETEALKWWGWFMKAPLLFDPTGGVFYDTKTNEGTKLTSEGRSTSTTITAFSILNRLDDAGFEQQDQKLLSFTDNRQDAALQAGHFNDFVQVVRLRAGICKALGQAPAGVLTYATLGEAVFKALGLSFLDFFRLEYAIHSENYLTQSRIKENEKHFREKLRAPWTLDRNEELREPFVIRYEPLHRSAKLYSKSMGPASTLGKFIIRNRSRR